MNKSMTIVAMAALMLTASCTQKETNEKEKKENNGK